MTNREPNRGIDAAKKDDASKVSDASQPPVQYDLTLLEEMNDAEYLRDILHCILTHTPGQLCELKEAAARQDFERICYLSHKMKSSIGILRCMALDSLLSGIEEQAKKRMDTTVMTQAVITMYDELEMTLKAELITIPYKCKQ